jgi:hypothetical protein
MPKIGSRTRKILLGGGAVAILAAPLANAAGEGQPVDGGSRNPSQDSRQSYTRETEIISNVNTYGTRQSNKSDNGGGAVYGCRSKAGGSAKGNEPCVRSTNLADGLAFEFNVNAGALGGLITVGRGGDAAKPFTTNATGVADGLNADRVDGRQGSDLLGKTEKAADADKLDGVDSAEFARAGNFLQARIAANGTDVLSGARPSGTAATAVDADTTRVTFPVDVSSCAITATPGGATPQAVSVAPVTGTPAAVDVNFATERAVVHVQAAC